MQKRFFGGVKFFGVGEARKIKIPRYISDLFLNLGKNFPNKLFPFLLARFNAQKNKKKKIFCKAFPIAFKAKKRPPPFFELPSKLINKSAGGAFWQIPNWEKKSCPFFFYLMFWGKGRFSKNLSGRNFWLGWKTPAPTKFWAPFFVFSKENVNPKKKKFCVLSFQEKFFFKTNHGKPMFFNRPNPPKFPIFFFLANNQTHLLPKFFDFRNSFFSSLYPRFF